MRKPLPFSLPALPQREARSRPLSLGDLPLLPTLASFVHIFLPGFGIPSIFEIFLQHSLFWKASPYAMGARVNMSHSLFPMCRPLCQPTMSEVTEYSFGCYLRKLQTQDATAVGSERHGSVGRGVVFPLYLLQPPTSAEGFAYSRCSWSNG